MTSTTINAASTMQEVLAAYPNAQRGLFTRYHIGGCNSCGYQPTDTLEQVAQNHKIHDIDQIVAYIQRDEADALDRNMQVQPVEVAAALRDGPPLRLVDVRTPEEWELARIPGATLITEELAHELMRQPRDTSIVFYCHVGARSLDAAAYYAGHGFKNVRSMTGGIDAWSSEVDESVPRYEMAPDPYSGGVTLRTLRSVVSQEAGCRSKSASKTTFESSLP
jgi:rhodanese-related sulfurtransferase